MYPNEARFYQSKGKIHKLLNQIHTNKLTKVWLVFGLEKKSLYNNSIQQKYKKDNTRFIKEQLP